MPNILKTLMARLLKWLPRLKIIDRHEGCVGIRLYRFGRKSAQIWFCPAGYKIERHSHEEQDIELMFFCGDAKFFRLVKHDSVWNREETKEVKGLGNPFKTFTIPAGTIHWFEVSTKPLVFINFSTWNQGIIPSSAAIDFKKV